MKTKESKLREMSGTELRARESELRKELFNLRFQGATGEVVNPMRRGTVRREIARILTVLKEKAE